jgi:hypothetical protein
MKTVVVEEVSVSTPWLNTAEAAAYCGMSETAFLKRAKDVLPYAGTEKSRRYLPGVLDVWIVRGYRTVERCYEEFIKGGFNGHAN